MQGLALGHSRADHFGMAADGTTAVGQEHAPERGFVFLAVQGLLALERPRSLRDARIVHCCVSKHEGAHAIERFFCMACMHADEWRSCVCPQSGIRYPVVVRFENQNYAGVTTNNYALDEVVEAKK